MVCSTMGHVVCSVEGSVPPVCALGGGGVVVYDIHQLLGVGFDASSLAQWLVCTVIVGACSVRGVGRVYSRTD